MADGDRLFTIPSGLKGKKLPIRYNIDNGNVVFEEGMVGSATEGGRITEPTHRNNGDYEP